MNCDTCANRVAPALPGCVPTCRKAGPPNACVLAFARIAVDGKCPKWAKR